MKQNPSHGPLTKEQQRLQMADVARLAGVSTSTVSRALSGSSLVNDETRERIAELARSLGYTVNLSAKNLRLKQNRTIAVVVPYDSDTRQHLSDPFFLAMLGSIADALTDRGFDMLVSRVDANELYAASLPFDTGRALGVILIGQWRHHDQLNQIAARKVPVVVWGAQLPQQLYVTVGSDNHTGGFVATEHLIKAGRRRIAFFGDTQLPEVAQRYEGYCAALGQYGIALDTTLCVAAPFSEDGAVIGMRELMKRNVTFDGLFACSDLLATSAINELRHRQLTVPDDVAVVGYDDIELARYFHPPLTTVRQSIRDAGNALVDALLGVLNEQANSAKLLPTQLVVRASA